MEPPSKAPKLSLSEAADVLKQQDSKLATVSQTHICSVSKGQAHKGVTITTTALDFSQEEEEENEQIQASLPLYFDHVFGTCVGHSQPQATASLPHVASQSQYLLPQSSLGFSLSDSRLLDSQGFIFNSSTSLIGSSIPASSSVSPTQTQFLKSQPTGAVTVTTASTLQQSPAVSVLSSPSSTSNSPSSRSNRSGTPVLFPSPSRSPVHSCSPKVEATLEPAVHGDEGAQCQTCLQQPYDTKAESVLTGSCSLSHQQAAADDKVGLYSLRRDLKCKSKGESTLDVSCLQTKAGHKRKLSFVADASGPVMKLKYACPPCCTLLSECIHIHRTVSIFAIVLQVNPTMDVACKAGSKAGYTVPMSSLLLGDPSKSYFKLSLWREAAAWVERISASDVVLFKNVKLKSWQKEVVGTTVMHSSVLNLHQPKKQLPEKVRKLIPMESLDGLLQWGRKSYGYLFRSSLVQPKSQKAVNFLSSDDLGRETLIHFRAKLLSLISSRVLLLSDEPGMEINLYLLCVDATVWHSQLSGGVGQVWEFMFIAVTLDGATQGGGYSLQTTSCSFLRQLQEDCQQATNILAKFQVSVSGSTFISKGCSVADLTSTRVFGIVEVQAKALGVWFFLCDGLRFDLSQALQLDDDKLISQLCQILYVGCESCSKPLQQDVNGVYCQCLPCMLKKPGGYPSSAYYFRPMMVALQDTTGLVGVSANHAVIPKVLGIRASEIVKASLAQSEELGRLSEKLRKTWQQLEGKVSSSGTPTPTNRLWTVNCIMSKDENSFVEAVSFTLLDVSMHS